MQHAVSALTRSIVADGITSQRILVMLLLAHLMTACGGGGGSDSSSSPLAPTYTIGGTVTGLAGTGLILQNSGGNNLAVAASGAFTFTAPSASGAAYAVTAQTQPTTPSQTCTVTNGAGTIASSNITTVAVNCVTNTYTVTANVTGLTGSGLVLQNNGGNNLAVTTSGSSSFSTAIASGGAYNVQVLSQPTTPSQTCTVTSGTGTGTITTANIATVAVNCVTNTYTVTANVTGLTGSGLVLQNNSGNNLAVATSGSSSFSTAIASGAAYNVQVLTQPTTPSQTCTVTSGTGTITTANVTTVAVNCVINSFTVNANVSGLAGSGLVLQNNGGNDLAVTVSGNAAFSTMIASGATYDIRVLSQPATPNQRCTVTNARGSVTNAAVTTPTVVCVTQVPRFAYAVDYLNSTLSIYGVDASTGQLRPRGYVPTGANPTIAIPDPAQKFWFVLSAAAATLSVYRHDDVTGDLVEVSGSPYSTGGTAGSAGPTNVVVHPSGSFVYVTNGSGTNNVAAFAINSTSGMLAPVTGSPFAAGTFPLATTIDATGSFAYVTNRTSNNIYTYSINATTGALTEVASSRVATGAAPGVLSLHANARLAYVPNNTDGTISAFTVNPSTGLLTAVAGSPFAAGTNPTSIAAIHSSGKFLYLRNANAADTAGTLSAYTINQSTGVLTAIGTPVAIGANSSRLVFDPAGKFAFVTNQGPPNNNGSLSEFSVNPTTGALTALTGVPVWGGRPYWVTVDPSGQYVYVTNAAANLHSAYSLNASSGALAPITQGATLTSRDQPLSLSVYSSVSTPTAATYSSKFAYVTNGNIAGSIGAYQVNATTGALSLFDTATFASMQEPVAAQVNQNGTTLIVANRTGNALWFYNILGTGALTSTGSGAFTAGGLPTGVALDTSSRFAYTANISNISVFGLSPSSIGTPVNNFGAPIGFAMTPNGRFLYSVSNGTLGRWVVDPTTGALLAGGGVTISGATSLAIDPTGSFAYVGVSSGIAVYTINTIDGFTPTTAASTVTTNLLHKAMAVDPTGRFLYAANGTSNTVSAFSINPSSGSLTAIGSPIAAGTNTNVVAIATDYSGKYVYAVYQGSNTVITYAINTTTGALTAVASGTAATGTVANSISLLNVMQ